ncbi:hypothetical protein Leryth_003296 [Lithospermum erythrorhizon]|nr:hypothetical protein Leryth_003296 [Lithospermum erythrorhizon]
MPGPTGQLNEQTNGSSGFEGEGVVREKVVNNGGFVQNHDGFLGELHRDHANAKISMRLPVVERNHENGVGPYQPCFGDLTSSVPLRRMDSGCSSHVIDYASHMGLMENGIHFNNNCGVPHKDIAFGQGVKKPPSINGFNQASSSSGVQPLTEDSASWQGLKMSSHVNQSSSSASAPNLTELECSQSPQHSRGTSEGSQSGKVKFLCSSGGKILPRPSDGKLRYVGGETRMVSIGNNISWAALVQKTSGICNQPHTIKYQLPGEELDALISVSSDEDLQNMIEEYYSGEKQGVSQRLRIFLVPLTESENVSTIDTSAIQQGDPDYQYVVAVNGVTRVNSNLSEYSNGQSMKTGLNHLTSTLDRNTSFQENTLVSWNPSQAVSTINGLTPRMNELQDMISPPIQCDPFPPVSIQQRDLKNELSLLHNSKLSPEITECPPLISTDKLPPENYSSSVHSSHNVPNLGGTNDANKSGAIQTDVLGVQVSLMDIPPTQILPNPVLEVSGQNMHECSFDKPVVEDRVLHSEEPFSRSNDTMNVFCESNNSNHMNHGMPHAFSDSKLQEYGGSSMYSPQVVINPYFSLNFSRPPMTADLFEKQIQHNEDVGLSNPHLKSKIPSEEPIVPNQEPNFIDFSFSPQSDQDVKPVPWDISIGHQNPESVTAASHKQKCMTQVQEENHLHSGLTDDTIQQFGDKKASAGTVETLDMLHVVSADQTFYEGLNKQVSGGFEPPSISLKPSKDQLVNKQLASAESSRAESDSKPSRISQLESAEIDNNRAQTPPDANLVTDLLSGLCSSLVSVESSVQQPFASPNNMDMGDSILMDLIQQPSAVMDDKGQNSVLHRTETENVDQNAYVRREYSLIDDDWNGNRNHSLKLDAPDHCTGNLQKNSAVVGDELNHPMGSSYSRTTQQQVDVAPADDPSVSMIEDERTLEELVSANENSDDGSEDGQITDAMIAEMEADVYGLQIIKNADLEDLRELGSGTFGTVYHGRWRGSDVAIKRIRKTCFSGRLSEQDRLIKDFWKEARILSNLHHPNVVAFYGVVPDGAGGTLATVTEYMSHGSLRSVLVKKDRFLDHRRKLMIAMDSAFGMEYLHSKNIIHFDLKCDNLLVSLRDPERPICKVGDFGLSKIKRNTLVSGGVRGTLPWMAPELLNGSTDLVSEKVDVFSFGISMWEILTGEEPYANMHYGAIIGGIVKNTLRPPIPERCDPEWRKLMEQCWSTNPEHRPSFTEIANRLRSMDAMLLAKGKINQQTKA